MDRMLGSCIKGSNQITDAYLLALAIQNHGRMVTFDYRMQLLAPKSSAEYETLVLLRP
jgi:predicted nucleic acid-binding protein